MGGLKSVEQVYKETKIKTALHMLRSTDPAVKAAAKADLIRMQKGRRSITRDVNTFANEISIEISINQDEEWEIKFESQDKSTHLALSQTLENVLTRARTEAAEHSIETQKWQGKIINNCLNDENIGPHCFDWLTNFENCPSETIRDVEEIYQRFVPTKVYIPRQTTISGRLHYLSALQRATRNCCPHSCGLPGISTESLHGSAQRRIKVLIFHTYEALELVNKIPPWHSAIMPKPEVKNYQVRILWDVPTHTAECRIQATSPQSNRPDVTVFDKQAQEILVVEFSCPWVTNRIKKDEEKMAKYQQVREELKARNPNYTVKQINIIMDVLGGMSMTLGKQLTAVIGPQEEKRTIRSM